MSEIKREDAYFVEVDQNGCDRCGCSRTYCVVGPDGVAGSTSYEDEEDADAMADALNEAFHQGRSDFDRLQQERDTLARRVAELEPNGYDVELHWGWGRTYSFRETERFHVQSLDEIDAIVQRSIIQIARRYTFDCGDISKPMHPHLAGLTVTPTARRQYQSTERFDTMMERERAHTETLIQSGGLYKGSNYDLFPAPPVTGGPR